MASEKDSDERGPSISPERFAPANISATLGPLADLTGKWTGHGFNLIAQPDFHDRADLYLQFNFT